MDLHAVQYNVLMMRKLVLAITVFVMPAVLAYASNLQFTPQGMMSWKARSFKGHTQYKLAHSKQKITLHAECNDSASGLFLKQDIDLEATPIIEWEWRVDNVFAALKDERTKPGDDYPARIYVVKKNGLLPWRTRAINYVWSSHMAKGSDWPNAFASQAHMVAVRAGKPPEPGMWVTERRNIREDFRRYHGIELREIDVVAIMTDCDNRSANAQAWYGAIRFLPAQVNRRN